MTQGTGIQAVSLGDLPEATRKVVKDLPRFTADQKYFQAHRKALLRNHDGKWVAIYKQKVVSAHEDREKVTAALRGRGIMPSNAAIHFVTSKERLCFF